jgi:hypothetical protein
LKKVDYRIKVQLHGGFRLEIRPHTQNSVRLIQFNQQSLEYLKRHSTTLQGKGLDAINDGRHSPDQENAQNNP